MIPRHWETRALPDAGRKDTALAPDNRRPLGLDRYDQVCRIANDGNAGEIGWIVLASYPFHREWLNLSNCPTSSWTTRVRNAR